MRPLFIFLKKIFRPLITAWKTLTSFIGLVVGSLVLGATYFFAIGAYALLYKLIPGMRRGTGKTERTETFWEPAGSDNTSLEQLRNPF